MTDKLTPAMTNTVGNIPATAPLWNGADQAELLHLVKKLSNASCHYADDSGKEWSLASALMREVAAQINQRKLCFHAIQLLHEEAPQLVAFDHLIDAVLMDARTTPKCREALE